MFQVLSWQATGAPCSLAVALDITEQAPPTLLTAACLGPVCFSSAMAWMGCSLVLACRGAPLRCGVPCNNEPEAFASRGCHDVTQHFSVDKAATSEGGCTLNEVGQVISVLHWIAQGTARSGQDSPFCRLDATIPTLAHQF